MPTNLDRALWVALAARPARDTPLDEAAHLRHIDGLLAAGANPAVEIALVGHGDTGRGNLPCTAFDILFIDAPPSSWAGRLRALLAAGLSPDTSTAATELVMHRYTPGSDFFSQLRGPWEGRWPQGSRHRLFGLPGLLLLALVVEPAAALDALEVLLAAGAPLRDEPSFLPPFSVLWSARTLEYRATARLSQVADADYQRAARCLALAGASPEHGAGMMVEAKNQALLADARARYLDFQLRQETAPVAPTPPLARL